MLETWTQIAWIIAASLAFLDAVSVHPNVVPGTFRAVYIVALVAVIVGNSFFVFRKMLW